VEGYQIIRRSVDRPIVGHYGGGCCHVVSDPSFDPGVTGAVQLREQMFDGFVLGGGDVDSLRSVAVLANQVHKPVCIQPTGTSLPVVWLAHLASTCAEGLLSHLAAHDLWVQDVVAPPKVVDGWVQVADAPGLGVAPDLAAVESLAKAPPTPKIRRISTVVYPS